MTRVGALGQRDWDLRRDIRTTARKSAWIPGGYKVEAPGVECGARTRRLATPGVAPHRDSANHADRRRRWQGDRGSLALLRDARLSHV